MKKQKIPPGTRTWKYYWTYGNCAHTGKCCKVKADGHNINTNFQDRKGDSEMRLTKANDKWLIVNKHKNTVLKLCNKYLGENKIKRNLKVMFTRLFTSNVLSVVDFFT